MKTLPTAQRKIGVGVSVSPDILKALDRQARAEDRTRSHLIMRALKEYLDRHAGKGTGA